MHQLRQFVRRHPLGAYYTLSVLIVIITIPLFLLTGAQEAVDRAFTLAGIPFNTDLVTWGRLVLAYPDAWFGALLAVVQVGAPDIAVLLVAPVAFGWAGLAALKRRFRFWAPGIGWWRGLGAWAGAVLTFAGMSLATAALSRWVFPVEGFVWRVQPLTLGFAGGLLITMFLDGGGLLEENGWRGFALPLLLERYTPLLASVALGLLWALWHVPVKFDLALSYGAAAFALMFAVLSAKFVLISVIMTYFWQRAGQTTIIAIAMHGLSNDAVRLGGETISEAFAAQLSYELNLVLPMMLVAGALTLATRGRLGAPEVAGAAERARGVSPSPGIG